MKQIQQKPRTFSPINLVRVPHQTFERPRSSVVYIQDEEVQARRFNRNIIGQAAHYKQQRDLAIVISAAVLAIILVLSTYLLISAAATIQESNSLCREIAYEREIYKSQLEDEQRSNAALRQEIERQNTVINNYKLTLDYYGLLDN